jgi:VanZ family protein
MLVLSAIAAYMGFLVVLAVTTPGIGPIGHLMVVLPGTFMEWMHAPAYGLLALLAIRGFRHRGWPVSYALGVGLLFALVFGLWTEVAQASAPGRSPSVDDLVVDGIGIAVAGSLVAWQELCPAQFDRAVVLSSLWPRRISRGVAS